MVDQYLHLTSCFIAAIGLLQSQMDHCSILDELPHVIAESKDFVLLPNLQAH